MELENISSISFLKRLHQLEDQKIALVEQAAWLYPEKQDQFQKLNDKLEKYYRWYAKALLAGKL